MTELIAAQDQRWDSIVESFPERDIYYTSAYAKLSCLGTNKRAFLVYTDVSGFRMCMPIIVADISESKQFTGILERDTYFDAETPYGYGGPLYDGIPDEKKVREAFEEIKRMLRNMSIISVFIRFHPMLENYRFYPEMYDDVRYMHHTVYMNTESPETIFSNLDSKNRNMIRKAKKNGVVIKRDDELSTIGEFRSLYEETMDFHEASDMYYFSTEYYRELKRLLGSRVFLLNACLEDRVIASGMFLVYGPFMHYHLSGSRREYRQMAASNLLLYEAALHASSNGVKKLHLGGGMREDDSLFGFKKQFNKKGFCDFWIGKIIADHERYESLLDIRENHSPEFDRENSFMIQYRR